MAKKLTGVDLSHWNRITSYTSLVSAVDFVIHKATEGTTYVDPTFVARMGQLRKAGGRRGSYHFAVGGDPVAEAKHYLKVARPRPGELVVLDVEAKILRRPDLVAWCAKWFVTVAAAVPSCRLVIYMSHSVIGSRSWAPVAKLGVILWAARYAKTEPAGGAFGQWAIWQYTSKGSVPGVAGHVDRNRTEGDPWALFTGPPAAPKPVEKPAAAAPAASYTVKRGDTLAAIGRRFGLTWQQLAKLNADRYPQIVSNPNHISVGWKLRTAADAAVPNKAHTVSAGDTLSKIAAAARTSVAELVQLNHGRYPSIVKDPNLIQVGWVLYLP